MRTTAVALFASLAAASAQELPCRPFHEVYADGAAVCNNMFGDAFVYTEDEENAFTMWFLGENPNHEVARRLGHVEEQSDKCHLDYFHKEAPSPEGDDFNECHPWKEEACCTADTVASPTKLKEAYGPEYHWDRCGKLSESCERFFVQEACLYECSPNIGFYRRFPEGVYNESNPDHNEWEVYQMPVKASYCNAWHTACYNDMFCAEDNGNLFSCARVLPAEEEPGLSSGTKALIAGLSSAGAVMLIIVCCLVYRERKGQPVFKPLSDHAMDEENAINQPTDVTVHA